MTGTIHYDFAIAQDEQVTTIALMSENVSGPIGSAKRHPHDANNPDIGLQLAMSRLFGLMAAELRAQVDAMIDEADSQNQPPPARSQKADRMMEIFLDDFETRKEKL